MLLAIPVVFCVLFILRKSHIQYNKDFGETPPPYLMFVEQICIPNVPLPLPSPHLIPLPPLTLLLLPLFRTSSISIILESWHDYEIIQVLIWDICLNDYPTFQGAKAHYQTLEAEYSTQVSKLQKLVDSAVDPVQFLGISEAQIKDDLEEAKACIKKKESIETFEWVASAARKAKRVMDVIEAKMESINKPELKQHLQHAKERIATSRLSKCTGNVCCECFIVLTCKIPLNIPCIQTQCMCKYSVGMYTFILHLNKLSPSISRYCSRGRKWKGGHLAPKQ